MKFESVVDGFAAFKEKPEYLSLRLRYDLANLIENGLENKGWTQRRLAKEAGKRESYVSRLVHGEANCTFAVAARVLHALGIMPALVDKTEVAARQPAVEATEQTNVIFNMVSFETGGCNVGREDQTENGGRISADGRLTENSGNAMPVGRFHRGDVAIGRPSWIA